MSNKYRNQIMSMFDRIIDQNNYLGGCSSCNVYGDELSGGYNPNSKYIPLNFNSLLPLLSRQSRDEINAIMAKNAMNYDVNQSMQAREESRKILDEPLKYHNAVVPSIPEDIYKLPPHQVVPSFQYEERPIGQGYLKGFAEDSHGKKGQSLYKSKKDNPYYDGGYYGSLKGGSDEGEIHQKTLTKDDEQFYGSGRKKKVKNEKRVSKGKENAAKNPWVAFVKNYAKEHEMKYHDAMKEIKAKKLY